MKMLRSLWMTIRRLWVAMRFGWRLMRMAHLPTRQQRRNAARQIATVLQNEQW